MQVARASIILGDLGAAVPVYDMANLVLGAYAGDQVAREFFSRLHDMVKSRLWINRKREWESAYDLRGPGSGNLRKRDVGTIYSAAAPVSDVAPMPIASEFLDEACSRFKEAALAAGAEVL